MIERVSTAEAWRLMSDEDYAFIDVRTPAEYAAGHPAGALNVPFALQVSAAMTQNDAFLPVIRALFPTDAPLVIGCAAGVRSLQAAQILAAAGYTRVVDQRAGYIGLRDPFGGSLEQGWASSGLPIETSTPGGSYAELLQRSGL